MLSYSGYLPVLPRLRCKFCGFIATASNPKETEQLMRAHLEKRHGVKVEELTTKFAEVI